MGGLLNALNAGKTSLSTNQKAIEIAGNNIANVNTPGYSRQNPVLTPYPSLNFGDFFIGQGVKISNVQREHDVFISAQILDKNRTLGEESARSGPLNELERIFSVGEDSLATEVDRFFDSWQELTANPSGQVERDIVLQRGDLLARAFQSAVGELDAASKNINSTMASKIDAVNFKLQEVADLNERISAVETTGQTANTFRDQRDVLLEDLSFSLGVQSFEESTGMVSVQLPGGLPLVQGNAALQFEGVPGRRQSAAHPEAGSDDSRGQHEQPRRRVQGDDGGARQIHPVPAKDLDTLAYDLATAVNDAHKQGLRPERRHRRRLFHRRLATGRRCMPPATCTVALTSGSQSPPASAAPPATTPMPRSIAALGGAKTINGEDTFVGFYGKMTARVGIEAGQNRLTQGGAEDAMVQLKNLRDGKVGVSLEEEMINLIQFQKGFEASAKFLATVDEMMDTILSLKR